MPMRSNRPHQRWMGGIGLCSWALLLTIPAFPTIASAEPFVERNDAEMMLLEVLLRQHVLNSALTSFASPKNRDKVLVPLGELSRSLGIAVEVNPDMGTAEGFVIQESRGFKLDVAHHEARVGNSLSTFDPSLVEVHADDIYVEAGLVGQWLPVALDVSPFEARLKVRPREPLPLELRLERENRGAMSSGAASTQFPRLETPYQLWGWPTIDQKVDLAMRPSNGGLPAMSARYGTLLSGEYLYMNGQAYLTGDDQHPVSDFRFSLGRRNPEGGLLGILNATEVAIGQVNPTSSFLSAGGGQWLGATISNFPLTQPNQFDRHTFRGNLPPGWDVEIYRGASLMGHQSSREDGLYTFEDVPLLIGDNEFRLVFYGPQGQRREESFRFNIGDALTPPGQHRYRVSSNLSSDGTPTLSAQYDVGLFKQLSLSTGALSTTTKMGRQEAAQMGLRGFYEGIFANGDFGLYQGGVTGQLGLQTRLGPVSAIFKHTQAWGTPWQTAGTSVNRTSTNLRLDMADSDLFGVGMSAALVAGLNESLTGDKLGSLSFPLSMNVLGILATNRLNWNVRLNETPEATFAGANLQLGTRFDDWSARGDIAYDTQAVRSLGFTCEGYRLPWDYILGVTASYGLQGGDSLVMVKLGKNWGFSLMGLTMTPQDMGLSLSSSLTTDPALGQLHFQAMPQGGNASVIARVFLDLNRNGKWDHGEPPLEHVDIAVDSGDRTPTGPDGLASFDGLPSYNDATITLLPETLSEPMWAPKRVGARLFLRPGQIATVDFPVEGIGEVNGTVFLKGKAATEELAGARLELLDTKGAVVSKTISAYDGFYTLTGIPPGQYLLRIPPEQVTKGKLRKKYERQVIIKNNGTLLEGLDFTLEIEHAKKK